MDEIRETLEAPLVPQTEVQAEIAVITHSVGSVFEVIFGTTFSENWKSYTLEEQLAFRNVVEAFYAAACIVREKFDADVWKGHSDGTVNLLVTSVRKQRTGEAPGKKKAELTPAEILAKRLAK